MRWKKDDRDGKMTAKTAALILCAVLLTGTAGCAAKKEQASAPAVETSEEANIITTADKATESADAVSVSAETTEAATVDNKPAGNERSDKQLQGPISAEIHYLLDPELVLDEENQLKEELLDEFDVEKKGKTYSAAYLDSGDRVFESEGWINRIRLQDGKADKGFELTYKKRYSVEGTDVAAAVKQAQAEGLDLSGEFWEGQVDWSYSGLKLSVSYKTKCPVEGKESVADLDLPEAVSIVGDNMPKEERDWKGEQWGSNALESVQMAGPVSFTRYKGTVGEQKVQIEIWEIPGRGSGNAQYIAEVSAKVKNFDDAAQIREELGNRLEEMGILLEEDSLKTQKVLDAFLGEK